VDQCGLEFYPLGGDPRALSALLVKTGGWLVPNAFSDADMAWLKMSFDMIGEIMHSTYPACTAPDPDDPLKRAFRADAIIANPVAYGHIHCAEALKCQLHMFFLQPWTPTTAFPHPFSNLPYAIKESMVNKMSYYAVDGFFWTMGMKSHTADFRKSIGLDAIDGMFEFGIELTKGVPFGYLWSDALVPTPADWPEHVDVCGTIFDMNDITGGFTPRPELAAFFAGGVTGSKTERLGRMVVDVRAHDEESPSDEEVCEGRSGSPPSPVRLLSFAGPYPPPLSLYPCAHDVSLPLSSSTVRTPRAPCVSGLGERLGR